MKTLSTYIQELVVRGKYFFSKQSAIRDLGMTAYQFRYQAYRLSRKKALQRLIRDFYMIVPLEYRALGTLPQPWIISPLMEYLGRNYYIGLLSASAWYGVAEQQPMVFQVIVDKAVRTIGLPRGMIKFFVKKRCALSAIDHIKVPTGYVNISTKEQTVVDLVGYYKASGGLSNVALILKDLCKECKARSFEKVVENESNTASLQRLGYLLELLNYEDLAHIVKRALSERTLFFVLLRPDFHEKTGERLVRWKLILNDYVELS